jgi:glucose-6-phosphate 1-dehydrogenase
MEPPSCFDADARRADDIEAGWRMVQPILDAWPENRAIDRPDETAAS